jgi:F-type H+-transporting ATPase subunit b
MTVDWWTLGFQTVNIVILVWLLQRFFWKPVSAMIAERRAQAQKALSEAQAARDKAKLDLVDIDKTRAGFAAEREKILSLARDEASQQSAAKLAQAGQQGEALVAAAKAALEKD